MVSWEEGRVGRAMEGGGCNEKREKGELKMGGESHHVT